MILRWFQKQWAAGLGITTALSLFCTIAIVLGSLFTGVLQMGIYADHKLRDTLALLHHEADDIAHQFDQRLRATKRLPPDAVYAIKAWRDL